jgi:hypothetical protein
MNYILDKKMSKKRFEFDIVGIKPFCVGDSDGGTITSST